MIGQINLPNLSVLQSLDLLSSYEVKKLYSPNWLNTRSSNWNKKSLDLLQLNLLDDIHEISFLLSSLNQLLPTPSDPPTVPAAEVVILLMVVDGLIEASDCGLREGRNASGKSMSIEDNVRSKAGAS